MGRERRARLRRRRRRTDSNRSSVGSIARYCINLGIGLKTCLKVSRTSKTSSTSKKNTSQLLASSQRGNKPQKANENIPRKPSNLPRSSMNTTRRRTSTSQRSTTEPKSPLKTNIEKGKITSQRGQGSHQARDFKVKGRPGSSPTTEAVSRNDSLVTTGATSSGNYRTTDVVSKDRHNTQGVERTVKTARSDRSPGLSQEIIIRKIQNFIFVVNLKYLSRFSQHRKISTSQCLFKESEVSSIRRCRK